MSSPVEILPGLHWISLFPLDISNVYLLNDVLVDSSLSLSARKLIALLKDVEIRAHAITHAHFDHQGASHQICEQRGIPLWCGEPDRLAMETGDFSQTMPDSESWIGRLGQLLAGPAQAVSRSLREGDRVGEFVVIETPGHTPGHISFWREKDRALVLGDVLFHRNPMTLRLGLQEPFKWATVNPEQNRESTRKVAALMPEVICFGHGPPLKNSSEFSAYVAGLAN